MSSLSRGSLDEYLSINDLGDIFEDFFDAREKWYNLGLHLKLKVPTLESIGVSGNDSAEKFRTVLKEILEGKGHSPIAKSHFVGALEAKTVGYPQLAKELKQKYSNTPPGVTGGSSHVVDPHDTRDFQDSTSSSGYDSGNSGHMNVLPPALAPRQLTTTPHSTDQHFEKLLKRKLRRTKVSYSVVLKSGQESFKKRKVPVQDIAEVAITYPDQPELSHKELSRMSMDEVWAAFKKNTSWYNSELVEAVVRLHGSESDRKCLEQFQNDRKVFVHYLHDNSDQRKKSTIVLKLEEDFSHFSDERLEQICLTLCDMLETRVCPLDVQEGCVKVTVAIPAEVAENISPFSPATKKAFQKAFPTLISVTCGKLTDTFETAQDIDDSDSYDGQEMGPVEGFIEDGYYADRSGSDDGSESDEEECERKYGADKKPPFAVPDNDICGELYDQVAESCNKQKYSSQAHSTCSSSSSVQVTAKNLQPPRAQFPNPVQHLHNSGPILVDREQHLAAVKQEQLQSECEPQERDLAELRQGNERGMAKLKVFEERDMVNVAYSMTQLQFQHMTHPSSLKVVDGTPADSKLQNEAALFQAAKGGDVITLMRFIQAHVNVNCTEEDGVTPLMIASFRGHVDVVRVLIEAQARVNQQTKNGWTPLMAASLRGHVDVVSLLINANADVHLQVKRGFTALHLASQAGRVDVARLLIGANAHIKQKAKDGRTALNLAFQNGHTAVGKLLQRHADVSIVLPSHSQPQQCSKIVVYSDEGLVTEDKVLLHPVDSFSTQSSTSLDQPFPPPDSCCESKLVAGLTGGERRMENRSKWTSSSEPRVDVRFSLSPKSMQSSTSLYQLFPEPHADRKSELPSCLSSQGRGRKHFSKLKTSSVNSCTIFLHQPFPNPQQYNLCKPLPHLRKGRRMKKKRKKIFSKPKVNSVVICCAQSSTSFHKCSKLCCQFHLNKPQPCFRRQKRMIGSKRKIFSKLMFCLVVRGCTQSSTSFHEPFLCSKLCHQLHLHKAHRRQERATGERKQFLKPNISHPTFHLHVSEPQPCFRRRKKVVGKKRNVFANPKVNWIDSCGTLCSIFYQHFTHPHLIRQFHFCESERDSTRAERVMEDRSGCKKFSKPKVFSVGTQSSISFHQPFCLNLFYESQPSLRRARRGMEEESRWTISPGHKVLLQKTDLLDIAHLSHTCTLYRVFNVASICIVQPRLQCNLRAIWEFDNPGQKPGNSDVSLASVFHQMNDPYTTYMYYNNQILVFNKSCHYIYTFELSENKNGKQNPVSTSEPTAPSRHTISKR